ncbi:MAG: cation:proton antiporter, partial [Gammaproteobacteria bacterium]
MRYVSRIPRGGIHLEKGAVHRGKPVPWRPVMIAALLFILPAPVFAGSSGLSSLVQDIGFCVVLAGLFAIVFTRLGIPEIAAFLVAGVVLGPIGTGLVTEPGNIETIAELGLIFLLFLIGLE